LDYREVRVICRACATGAPFQLACEGCDTRLENLVARHASEAARMAWDAARDEEGRIQANKERREILLLVLGVPLVLLMLAIIFLG
jgi:hypothetical protein